MHPVPQGNANHEIRVTELTVNRPGSAIFENCVTHIKITDEAAGEYVLVEQPMVNTDGQIQIDPLEWESIRDAIDYMVQECRDQDGKRRAAANETVLNMLRF